MSDDALIKSIVATWSICKWFFWQMLIFYLTPYLWEDYYSTGTIVLIFLYTAAYAIYWENISKEKRFELLWCPYVIYSFIAVILYWTIGKWYIPIWFALLLPLYGALLVTCSKILRKYFRKLGKQYKLGWLVKYAVLAVFLISLKSVCVSWECSQHGSLDREKKDIFAQRDYLSGKLITDPQDVLNEMHASIGEQFQGEWALYSCSMFSAALVNISCLYPETRTKNLHNIDSLIQIVISPELRRYDAMRWYEDPLETLDGNVSHISYLNHLAWMICSYKRAGGGTKYDKLLSSLCETMNRRILNSKTLNLPTYPGESIYVPDMLVAIVALKQYADMNKGKYRTTVRKWVERAQKQWIDDSTGLLVSFLQEDGMQYDSVPVKGSYSALNCYYLTYIDADFAKKQYETLKSLFWKDGIVSGLKEYYDRTYHLGLDIDAGPILFELSPSGTAFMTGTATYFNDAETRNGILTTAEIAGHTVRFNGKRHYLLANIALVGESIMLAMRTHFN